MFAMVDDEDFEELNQFKWHLSKKGYARRNFWINDKRTVQPMHRFINKTPHGLQTDHIDGNKLNNQKSNLRTCTNSQNMMNKSVHKNNRLGIRGVRITRRKRKSSIYESISARISVNGASIYLGAFKTVKEAALAYNDAAKKYFGEFAWTNKL